MANKDIIVTWPKSRPLASYLTELRKAKESNQVINFRVHRLPKIPLGSRCYRVHNGNVHGYTNIIDFKYRSIDVVSDPVTGGFWPEGNYIVCDPEWHSIDPIPMAGFQGWKYFKEAETI